MRRREKRKKILAGFMAAAMILSAVPANVMAAKTDKQAVEKAAENDLRLWYTKPASEGTNILSGGDFGTTEEDNTWQQQTLPIGNSLMGANVYGEVSEERLTFNQEDIMEWRSK